jgi:hypothetical protein
MAKGNHRAAGGPQSRVNVEPGYRHGQQKKRTIPAGVAQIGQRQGNHITERGSTGYGGVDLFAGQGYPSKLGNRVAVETTCGPGGSREVMKSGSQGLQGAPNPGNPMPVGEIFPGFGPRK